MLWAGTDHGLNRIEFGSNPAKAASPAWKVAVFDIRHGLVDNRISAMVEDDLGHFWIGCQRGICRVSRTELDAVAAGRASQVQCVVYDEADGLRSAEVSGQRSQPTACKTSDGHLWFATAKGAVRFDPARVIQGDRPPPVAIDLVEVDDETRFRLVEASGSGSCLPLLRSDSGAIGMPRGFPTQPGSKRGRLGRLNVFCAAPTFRGSDRVRFRYRLEGWDTDWVQAGADRAARYTNLKPGTYRFRVRAATHFGLWNETGADLAFVVRVPFHETWWFTWACAGAVAGALGTAIRWHYRELKRVHAIERQYTLARERERIARDMHDNLGAGLTRLALLGERMARQSENPTIHDSAIRLADEATHLVDNLDGLVWAADPKHDRLADTLAFLREHAAMFLADAGIETRLVFPSHVPDHHMRGAVRRAVCLALEEALTNAIRHARASQITVTAHLPDAVPGLQQTSESPAFEITVTDNGRGFEMPCAGTPETPRTETGTECTTPVVPAGSIAVPVPSTPEPGTVHRGGPGGMGLPAMDARLRDCGGRLQVRSALGRGTTIVLRVPLDVVGG